MKMTCIQCKRERDVEQHESLSVQEQRDKYDYVCCQCCGIGQRIAVLIRKRGVPSESADSAATSS
jgi:hypothetical protein